MAEVGSAFVSILPSARGFGSKLESEVGGEVGGTGKSIGSKFGTAFKVGAVAVLAGAALVGKFLKGAVEEAREAQVVTARTENVIKSMGLAGKVSATQIADLAGEISAKTGIDDEAIQSGQNLLLTFKNVASSAGQAGGVFERTSGLMVDLSAAMGTDAKGAAIQLGKALNDPVKGISALSRVGVSFSEQQKEQIANYVETGRLAKAQGVILGELQNQFGGAAEAMATPAMKAETAYNNLKEQIGTALLPVIDRLLNVFVAATPAISAAISGIGPAFAQVQAFLAPVFAQISGFFGGGGGGGLLAGITSLGAAIAANFLPVLQTMASTFTGTVLPALTSLATYLASSLGPIFTTVFGIIRDQVVPILASFAQFIYGTVYPAIVQIITTVAGKLKPVFDQLVATFKADVLPTLQKLIAKFQEWQPTIQSVIAVVIKIIGKVLEFAAAVLGKVLPVVIRFAGFLISNVVPAVANVIGVVIKIIAKIIEFAQAVIRGIEVVVRFARELKENFDQGVRLAGEFASGVKKKLGEAIDFVKGIPGKISDAIGDLGSLLYDKGQALIQGLIDGIKSMIGSIPNPLDAIPGLGRVVSGVAGKVAVAAPVIGVPVMPGTPLGVGTGSVADVVAAIQRLEVTTSRQAPAFAGALNGAASRGHKNRRAA